MAHEELLLTLEDMGLTKSEGRVYIALLKLGPSKAGTIKLETKLQNSLIHSTLRHLVEKGLVSFIIQEKSRHYQAADPKSLFSWLDEKKEKLNAALPALLAQQNVFERQEAEVFEGMRGFKAMCYKLIEDAEQGDEYRFFAFITPDEEVDREVYEFYRQFSVDRLRRGIKIKGVSHESRRELFKSLGYDLKTIRFVNFPTIKNLSIFRDKIIMTPWEDRQVSFLVNSRQLAMNFREYFDSIWGIKER